MKAEGIWGCDVLSAKYGANDKNLPAVQINVRISDGPSAGQLATYEDVVGAQSAKYIRYSVEAVGGNPLKLENLETDVAAWVNKTGGKSTVEIRHIAIKRGKKYDDWMNDGQVGDPPIWDKVQGIGRGAPRPLSKMSADAAKDAADAMRAVMGDTGASSDADDDSLPF